jgi:iron complex transport system substrate-binding protein
LIELIGGKNIFNLTHNGVVSREAVLSKNPDIIIISGMGAATKEVVEKWASFPNLNASKSGKIFAIDPYKIGSPTPISFIKTVKEIREKIDN